MHHKLHLGFALFVMKAKFVVEYILCGCIGVLKNCQYICIKHYYLDLCIADYHVKFSKIKFF